MTLVVSTSRWSLGLRSDRRVRRVGVDVLRSLPWASWLPCFLTRALVSWLGASRGKPVSPSRRPGYPGRLSQNRACAVHTRLVGTTGCDPHRRPVYDPSVPSWLGTTLGLRRVRRSAEGRKRSDFVARLWVPALPRGVDAAVPTQDETGLVPRQRQSPEGVSVLPYAVLELAAATFAASAFPPLQAVARGWDRLSTAFWYCAPVLDLQGHRSFVLSFSRLPLTRNPADLHG